MDSAPLPRCTHCDRPADYDKRFVCTQHAINHAIADHDEEQVWDILARHVAENERLLQLAIDVPFVLPEGL